jgi:hypothetical protein
MDKARTVLPTAPDRLTRLPLHAELFLLGHDDDSGAPHVNEQSLAVGLAGAILLELWLARYVAIGWTFDIKQGRWLQRPGRLTLITEDLPGDPLSDAALAAVEHTRHLPRDHDQLRTWLRTFAATDLYERVRATMVTVGVLHRTSRRRYAGLVRTDTYTAVHQAFAVRTRAQIRSVVNGYTHPHREGRHLPDAQCVALCGLVDVLEVAPFLYVPDLSVGRLRDWLRHIVHQHDPTFRDVIAAVEASRGDLAVAAMR